MLVLAVWYSHNMAFLSAAALVAAATGLPTLPPVFLRLARFLGVGRSSPGVAEKLAGFDYRTLACGWLVMALGWIAMGASLWAMLRGLDFDADWSRLWQLYTAIVAMAVVGGFASMIPAGLALREAVFTVMLGPLIGPDQAAIVAIALRLTWLLAELLISVILYSAGLIPNHAFHRHSVYNEAESLNTAREIGEVAAAHGYELDDHLCRRRLATTVPGTSSATWPPTDARVRGIRFRRNFGKAAP